MTKAEALEFLKKDYQLTVSNWTFSKRMMDCQSYDEDEMHGCCYDTFENAEEALESLSYFCDGDFNKVEIAYEPSK